MSNLGGRFDSTTAQRYFEWVCRKVSAADCTLTRVLHSMDYTYRIPMDGNRYEDGIELRYRFGYETGTDDRVIASAIDICPCSVLEMMTALCIKCEEQIMHDPKYGDRTPLWFAFMLRSLGLRPDEPDIAVIKNAVWNFLEGNYGRDGRGGLFTVSDPNVDMRRLELWYQMNKFLEELEEGGGNQCRK